MKKYRADLHVHTVLSPCAGVEMIPPLIISNAQEHDINLIAITDHNSTLNIESVQKAAKNTDITVLPGMELQTREEVHVLCLFDTLDQIFSFQKIVDHVLPDIKNRPDFFGEQFVVDETGDYIKTEERLLLTSTALTFSEAYYEVNKLGGLFIPAHVNRQAFGLIANLGMIPADVPVEALEISRHIMPEDAYNKFPQITGYPLIQNGDVHYPDDFLGSTRFQIEAPSIQELKMALKASQERGFYIKMVK